MDRRTLLFMLTMSFAFFGVNFFFQHQNQEDVKKWNAQQAAKRNQKISQLEDEITKRAIPQNQLPLVELYGDEKGIHFLNSGTLEGNTILTLSWDEHPPQKVFSKKAGSSETLDEYYLMYPSQVVGGPLLYHKGLPGKMIIGDLPDFGKYDLQVVFLYPGNKKSSFKISPGDYIDGHFSLLFKQLQKLKKEKESDASTKEEPIPPGIVLLKGDKDYLPVAIYNPSNDTVSYLEDIESLQPLTSYPEVTTLAKTPEVAEEKYYVLENDFQQLVFSNIGGALVEINLPFQTEQNQKSVVREIEFDREIVQRHPYNARFPAHPFYTSAKGSGTSFEDHIEGHLGGYYPLLRRDLIENRNRKSVKVPPRFYALNIVSEYPEVAQLVYEVKKFTKDTIVFETVQHHRRITKTFTLANENVGAPYSIDLSINIEGDARGLWLTSGVPEVEWISGAISPSLKYRIMRNNKGEVESIDLPKDAITNTSVYPDWVCNSNGFFGSILNPTSKLDPGFRAQYVSGTIVPSRFVEIEQEMEKYKPQDLPGYMMLIPLNNKGGSMEFHVFAGPFADSILQKVDAHYSNPATGYSPSFADCQSFHGWFTFISEPFSDFLFLLMKFFYSITNSWAFSIILLTVALRIMLYPLNAWSTKSMLQMQQIAPEIAKIQEKYKKDQKKAQLEIMNLYREKKVNPMSGCVPLLIQMPFLIGMFDLLKSTYELRGASFIPGWIDNLTSPDVLFSWTTPIFFIGNQFHLLPVLLGLVMFFQQRMMSTLPKDPSLWTDQQRQQRAMGTIMTVVFAIMFYHFPSGLNIYWLSSMLLGMAQQWWTSRRMKAVVAKKA